jgi:hypothetical protein
MLPGSRKRNKKKEDVFILLYFLKLSHVSLKENPPDFSKKKYYHFSDTLVSLE